MEVYPTTCYFSSMRMLIAFLGAAMMQDAKD